MRSDAMAENHVGGLEDRSEDDFCSEDEEDLEEIDDSQLYFAGLVDRAEQARATWLSCFEKSVKAWIARATNDRTARHLLTAHLPRALCLSVNCPYEDVRLKMKRLLDVVEVSRPWCPFPRRAVSQLISVGILATRWYT